MSLQSFISCNNICVKRLVFFVFFAFHALCFRSLLKSNNGFISFKRSYESLLLRNRIELYDSNNPNIIHYDSDDDDSYEIVVQGEKISSTSNTNIWPIYTLGGSVNGEVNATATLLNLVAFGDKYFRKGQTSNTQSNNNIRNDNFNDDANSNDQSMPAFLSVSQSSDIGFIDRDSDSSSTILRKSSEWTKVVGCIADVHIQLTLSTSLNRDSDHSNSNNASNNRDMSDSKGDAKLSSNSRVYITGIADSKIAQGILAMICKNLSGMTASDILSLSAATLTREWGLSAVGLPIGRMNGFLNMMATVQTLTQQLVQTTSTQSKTPKEMGKLDTRNGVSIINDSYNTIFISSTPVSATAATTPIPAVSDITSCSTSSSSLPITGVSVYHPDEVAVLLSGGVDSSVALKLLLLQGYKVRAFYLKIWLEDELAHLNECPWEEDLQYATSVCEQLNVPLETLSLQKEYWAEVVQYTLAEAKLGRTPNPDIMCNSRIKFGMFYKYIGQYYYKVATGHYAQVRKKEKLLKQSLSSSQTLTQSIAPSSSSSQQPASLFSSGSNNIIDNSAIINNYPQHNNGNSQNNNINNIYNTNDVNDDEYELFCSQDPIKDQTYFLCNLRQDQLAKALFPIGHLKKSQVRELAELHLLPTRLRKDSQGICFLGKLKFEDFIEHYLGKQPGEIRDYVTGNIVGTHQGLWFHTVGQRKGLGPYMNRGTLHLGPWFVADKDPATNTLFVTNDLQTIDKPRTEFRVHRVNWISGTPPAELVTPPHYSMQLTLKLRHGPTFSQGTITLINSETIHSTTVGIRDTTANITVTANTPTATANADTVVMNTSSPLQQSRPTQQLKSSSSSSNILLSVKLHEKDKGIAPGQFAAFYHNDVCLGAGVIADTARDDNLGLINGEADTNSSTNANVLNSSSKNS